MSRQQSNVEEYQIGDKVRIRSGPNTGLRGQIHSVLQDNIIVESGETLLQVEFEEITNYSLAARRAWKVMPKRSGRPREEVSPKRLVSIRIECQLWEKLGWAVEQGLIISREKAINEWIREQLADF